MSKGVESTSVAVEGEDSESCLWESNRDRERESRRRIYTGSRWIQSSEGDEELSLKTERGRGTSNQNSRFGPSWKLLGSV